ncbi:MAG TPA: ATP-binding protein, partial [Isosphaeraceae bacterium]
LKGYHALDEGATRGLPQVLRTGRAEVHPEVSDALLGTLAPGLKPLRRVRELGCRSLMILPLVARGRTLGAISLLGTTSGRRFDPADLPLAEELACRAALAIDNARLYDEAQEAVRLRDQFLAMLAHELRNPLAPILNAASILRLRAPDEPQVLGTTAVIERQGRRMARLLDDLLDISRVTRGKITLRREPVSLEAIVVGAVQGCAPLIEERGHQLAVTLPPEPIPLEADPARLEQVLVNLLGNAAKYTEPGGRIWLSATVEGAWAVVRVRDTGVGIPAEMLGTVFDLFVQADHSLDRTQGGLGIGLTLVRNLVEMHGGTVSAFSAGPGQGSEFLIRLPLGRAPVTPPRPDPVTKPAAGQRILIVEDQKDNREMLRDLLQLWGHQVEVAEDGLAGVEAILRLRPDVALVDIGLPQLDGYGVAERIRASSVGNALLLVALTGYAQPEDRRRVRAAGFNAHLTKPVNLDELSRLLSSAADGCALAAP